MNSRRQFLGWATKMSLYLGTISLLRGSKSQIQEAKSVKIKPIEGRTYPESFLKFIQTARFDTPAEAISSVQDSRLAYTLVWQS